MTMGTIVVGELIATIAAAVAVGCLVMGVKTTVSLRGRGWGGVGLHAIPNVFFPCKCLYVQILSSPLTDY